MIVQHTTGCDQKHWPDPSIGKTWPGKCHNGCKEDDFHISHLFIYQSVVFPRNYPKDTFTQNPRNFTNWADTRTWQPNAPTFAPNLLFEDLSNFGWVSFPTIFFVVGKPGSQKAGRLDVPLSQIGGSGWFTIADSLANVGQEFNWAMK